MARAEPTDATQLPGDAVTVKPPLEKFTEMVEKLLDNIESTLQWPPQGSRRPPRPRPRDTPVVCIKVVSAEFYFHKLMTVHLELYLFYCFIHFLLYIGQY